MAKMNYERAAQRDRIRQLQRGGYRLDEIPSRSKIRRDVARGLQKSTSQAIDRPTSNSSGRHPEGLRSDQERDANSARRRTLLEAGGPGALQRGQAFARAIRRYDGFDEFLLSLRSQAIGFGDGWCPSSEQLEAVLQLLADLG